MDTTTFDTTATTTTAVPAQARRGLWLLPVWTVLLALGTLTHQPDYTTDFAAYAEYVTTDVFLVSHVLASIVGGALGVVGVVAALAHLVRTPGVRAAVSGTALTIVGSVVITALFGVAAFAQPAIGRAYQDGVAGAVDINSDVYGAPLLVTAVVGLLLYVVGAVLVGIAVRRAHPGLRLAGTAYAVLLPVYAVAGFVYGPAQPVAAVLLTAAVVVIALRLPAAASAHDARREA